jgi:hypothetical protein
MLERTGTTRDRAHEMYGVTYVSRPGGETEAVRSISSGKEQADMTGEEKTSGGKHE